MIDLAPLAVLFVFALVGKAHSVIRRRRDHRTLEVQWQEVRRLEKAGAQGDAHAAEMAAELRQFLQGY
jgi:hypothetical protein